MPDTPASRSQRQRGRTRPVRPRRKTDDEQQREWFDAFVQSAAYRVARWLYLLPVLVGLLLAAELLLPKTDIAYRISEKKIGSHRETRDGTNTNALRNSVVPDNYLVCCGRSIAVSGQAYEASSPGDTIVISYYSLTHFPLKLALKNLGLTTVSDPLDTDAPNNPVIGLHGVIPILLLLLPLYVVLVRRNTLLFVGLYSLPARILYIAASAGVIAWILLHHEFIPPCA